MRFIETPSASRLQILRDTIEKTLSDKGLVRFLSKQNDSCVCGNWIKIFSSLLSPKVTTF